MRKNKDNRQVQRKAEVHSLDEPLGDDEDGQDWYEYRGGSYCMEDQLELREECLQAIITVPRDRWANPQEADALIDVCFPAGVVAYA